MNASSAVLIIQNHIYHRPVPELAWRVCRKFLAADMASILCMLKVAPACVGARTCQGGRPRSVHNVVVRQNSRSRRQTQVGSPTPQGQLTPSRIY